MATSTRVAVRWPQRRVAAALVDSVALAAPFVVAIVAVIAAAKLLPPPRNAGQEVWWWLAIATVSGLVLFVSQRQARRLLPLSSLLRLTMAFPDRAPSRLNMAMRAGTVRDLERRVAHLHKHGLHGRPAEAAETILTLASALNAHDRRTRGHSERVRAYTDLLAEEMGLSEDERDRLRWSSLLHDIGKLQVGRGILNKAGPLDDAEWSVMHQHPAIGGRVTEPLHDWLGEWVHAVDQHHENFDGSGYPNGLIGDEISVGARMVAVADAFEVMTAMRSYKKPMDAAAARRELADCAGAQFDPAVVRAFMEISLGRLTWVMGPLAWLTSLRFVRVVRPVSPALRGVRNAVAISATLGIAALMNAPSPGYKAEADSLPASRTPFKPEWSNGSTLGALGFGPAHSRLAFSPIGRDRAMTSIVASSPVVAGSKLAVGPALPLWSEATDSSSPAQAGSPGPTAAAPQQGWTVSGPSSSASPAPAPAASHPKSSQPESTPPESKPASPPVKSSDRGDDPSASKSSKSNKGNNKPAVSGSEGDNSGSASHGNSVYAHDHSHDAECGNHGHYVSSHGSGC